MLPGEDGLLDHFAQRLCPKDQCTSTNLEVSKAQVGEAKPTSNDQYNGEPTLDNKRPEGSSDGPVLASVGPGASSDGPVLASSRWKDITHYNKFSYRMEADLEKVN